MSKAKQSITVDGVEYVAKGSQEPTNSNIKIVILQRGWNVIGRWSEDGDNCALDNAYIIRRWGTTEGLGQLALKGKQEDTVLDKAGRVEFHRLTVVATLNAEEDLWNNELV
ncbi:hypothetical protein [Pseudarthrobacter sp. ATCC 49987]|uniref:hypothetical protein n=1 Tax=Pseudarthrobacter sp. ATCC 49987 TaxID=2698204 RepID=UPI001367C29C|nr:hypothetical protein [Pseudarthrobacter sp. ATCC 49987]